MASRMMEDVHTHLPWLVDVDYWRQHTDVRTQPVKVNDVLTVLL
jgi:hypothetical protein